ncbi:unnamed protein product, partial [Iphiclides podalirius]
MSEVKGTKALELWCKRLVKDCPNVQIDNMTTSWRNGMAFCALVHHFRPDLIDLSQLKPENIYENNRLAFSIAEKHLGIPSLLDPEDMVENDVPDRLSVLTYLSQFYQRLSHTVNTKASEIEPKASSPTSTQPVTPIRFGKTGLDKCVACGLPVYLAQRLIVAQKLYHRRCFRCSKCSGHLNPKNFQADETSEFSCDSCKNEKSLKKIFNNNDQMGMVAFSNNENETKLDINKEEQVSQRHKPRPHSILDKINMFEKNIDKDPSIEQKLANKSSLKDGLEKSISVPPRRKKHHAAAVIETSTNGTNKEEENKLSKDPDYPDYLNPFSDDDDDDNKEVVKEVQKKVSTNPFGSSEDEEEMPSKEPQTNLQKIQLPTPTKRHIIAQNPSNPFWSDGEEPSSDEETYRTSTSMYKSSMATSTPNLPSSTPRRKKPKAPPPPPTITISAQPADRNSTSMDDIASISSLSSHNSTVYSDQKSYSTMTPTMKKKRPAPTPLDSLSTHSGYGESTEKGIDTSGTRSSPSDGGRRVKGPAPGLPLPERREVKMQMSPEELQVQLDMLETQQLGLERQGVLIEQMIRDKCDEAPTVPQEEIEDLVIQLCELVNEKNDLFRKQTELMYIRRQQRLEQEQADIEHEIRIIQSRPAVNRIDADKAREEELVTRLVEIVRMRDELVQQIEAERRRERQEDLAIATSIANKRAQRNSDSNASSIKSAEAVITPKKSKVRDKVKKQLKKAKHTLISKKKDEDKTDKDKKPK